MDLHLWIDICFVCFTSIISGSEVFVFVNKDSNQKLEK